MSDAQKRVPHGRRRLRRIDRKLRRSDPELASMLSIFSRLTAGETMPMREQLRRSPVLDIGICRKLARHAGHLAWLSRAPRGRAVCHFLAVA